MSPNMMVIIPVLTAVLSLVVASVIAVFLIRRSKRNAKLQLFKERWQQAQKNCSKPNMWPHAIIEADKLLDEALKLQGYKGKTMGERLVAAQRKLSDNDGVWFGHKLCNKITHEEIERLYKKDVQSGLKGLRQALQDLEVL